MTKIIIFGNSGSGKSTFAKSLSKSQRLAHLDLDTLAWQATNPPTRMPLESSSAEIRNFVRGNADWVIEGCYADLLEIVTPEATELIFMNLSIDACIENAKNRPWEPHKYASKSAQDENLSMLIDWIKQYSSRSDNFSYAAHKNLFDNYQGQKKMLTSNQKGLP